MQRLGRVVALTCNRKTLLLKFVRPFMRCSIAYMIAAPVLTSTELVGSSRIRIGAGRLAAHVQRTSQFPRSQCRALSYQRPLQNTSYDFLSIKMLLRQLAGQPAVPLVV
jgi:hypothetical protein